MQYTMWKLDNTIKNYDWGSKTALSELFNISNPTNLPQAEIWMGAHPAGTSTAISADGSKIKLDQLIADDPLAILGAQTYHRYHGLPYLFKVLSAQMPLSVQVHPELSKAKLGYLKENQLGIPLDSATRNYKDANHKPELIYALTPFWAMNGFRPIAEIIELFTQLTIPVLEKYIQTFANDRTDNGLKTFFHSILSLNYDEKQHAISALLSSIEHKHEIAFTTIKNMALQYPNDSGLFSPLILNLVRLEPHQAMFLKAQTPHAYLQGTGLEIMANSDNVLRAGLTSKHIDIDELFDNTTFHSIVPEQLLTTPVQQDNKVDFPVPVNDFAFEIINSDEQQCSQFIRSAEIIFCLEGKVTLSTVTNRVTITAGESVFIAYCAGKFDYQGKGLLARAFNHTN
ncbi:mannose-6-phosphate isomerase type 1 [Orbus hercynius]|uniref:mannose-6-phosphate isomerase n=1 Tax=Orbus hercynius TaxID=593135 RepID=A0A495RDE9_9GAMM|nr:mannose-6-phosphate isomerase, class I [Orbus hercynius]RKS85244.1 mannose-6-phosphate isomerase type 1 [Orbus hercynius]